MCRLGKADQRNTLAQCRPISLCRRTLLQFSAESLLICLVKRAIERQGGVGRHDLRGLALHFRADERLLVGELFNVGRISPL